ncbi:MAG: thiamine phosphate synthase [Thermodesulfobacteriota bacterium]
MKSIGGIGRLHVLTDTVIQETFSHVELAGMAAAGGADVVQYRQKQGSTRSLIETAAQIKTVCRAAGAVFIVNDRIDVALAVEADGVHLGQEDFPIRLARELLGPERIIGGSASTPEEARACVEDGADYIGYGPVFTTTSKDDAGPACGLEGLRQLCGSIDVPVIAIGGVSQDNAARVLESGAHGIAVISSVCCQVDPEEAAHRLCGLIRGE